MAGRAWGPHRGSRGRLGVMNLAVSAPCTSSHSEQDVKDCEKAVF